jgi:hypothetical protein
MSANESTSSSTEDTSEADKIKMYLESLKAKMQASNTDEQLAQAEPDKQSNQQNPSSAKQFFEDRTKQYLATHKPKLYILTPCYGGLCHVNYINKVMDTKDLLRSLGIDVVIQFIRNESLITRGRNNLIAKSMSDPNMTHVLFIDSDITWDPSSVLKLIIGDKELSGGIYPIKKYHWDRLTKENMESIMERKNLSYNKHLTETQLLYHNLLHYNFNYLNNNNRIENNMMEIYTLATGFMMLKRECIDKMIAAYPQYKYTDDCGFLQGDENKYAYALFDCAIVNDHYFSEDWMFCHRWKEIGGKIFVDITIDLVHTGQEDYSGRILSTLSIN